MPADVEIPRLDDFLAALRREGIPVGPGEMVRIRQAFATAPHLDRAGLRRFLGCLLVKRAEQQAAFDQLFDTWCPDEAAEVLLKPQRRVPLSRPSRLFTKATTTSKIPATLDETPSPSRRWRWYLSAVFALVAVGILWYVITTAHGPSIKPEVTQKVVAIPTDAPMGAKNAATPAPQIRFWHAQVDPQAIAVPSRISPLGLVALGNLFVLGALLLVERYWRLGRRRPVRLAPHIGGPSWMPLPQVAGSDTLLTGQRERRAMSWHIARFTAEDLTRRVDERATAEATAAAGGLTELHYHRATYPREVWLWRDTHCESPELAQLLDEIRASLRRSGLTVRVGGFPGIPTQVWWRPGDVIMPSAEDGHRDHVVLALLTDGADILRTLRAPTKRKALRFQLRNLRHWPHLAVVDFSARPHLARALAAFQLKVITPPELPSWIGGTPTHPEAFPSGAIPLHGDLLAWAAVCSLNEEGVDEASAQRLRLDLTLPLTAWQIRVLRRHGGGSELVWESEERFRLINWLLASGFDEKSGKLRPDCLARRAIKWWLTRYESAQKERVLKNNRLLPWKDTEAERRWALEAALLRLYLVPEKAVSELAQLAEAGFGRELRRRLALLRTWDMPREPEGKGINPEHAMGWSQRTVYLPWRWEDYANRPEILDVLHRLGLGGHTLQDQVTGFRPPMRFALAVGALAGLALAAFTAATVKYLNPSSTQIISHEAMLDQPPLPSQTLRHLDDKAGMALIGHPKLFDVITELAPGAEIPVQWSWAPEQPGEHNNPVEPYPGSSGRLFLGGTFAEPVRPCDTRWPQRSLAVVQGRPTDPQPNPAVQLAIALLDRGSADLVLVGTDWQQDLAQLPQRHPLLDRLTQLLVFLPPGAEPPEDIDWPGAWALVSADYGEAVEALTFEGLRRLETIDSMERLGGEGTIWLHGGPEKKDTDTRLSWVHLCPGTFTMGTSNADPEEAAKMKRSNEQPAHLVSLSAFEITDTEITNAQYRRFKPDHDLEAAADLPAVNVTWQQAREFCQSIGGDLPTEAQWEYAARTGSRNPWSFGADSNRLGEYAWYSENSNFTLQSVKQKKPSLWGLYDMHGNAWEWVSDFFGEYPETPQLNPTGSSKDRSWRVLRGGSFVFSPGGLRSADRLSGGPGGRDGHGGFRCVRVPARQD